MSQVYSYQFATHGFTKDQVDKIGNTIIYLSNELKTLSKTKILKLLFIIEESCIKKYGYPFFGIDFQIWKHGPVAKDIFIDLSEDQPEILKGYIEKDDKDPSSFKAAKTFNDDEFSDNDINLLDNVISFAKGKTAKALVNYTHGKNSLWRKCAIKNGVLELLEEEQINSTDYGIEFELLFEENSELLERYEASKENLEFSRRLKRS